MLPVLLLLASALLPAATGRYTTDRVTVEWVDRSRPEPLDANHGYRTLAVDVWYPIGTSSTSPVLIFSPGGGMKAGAYTAQLGDLASHGYIVAAITPPYDNERRWPKIPSVEGEWNLNQLDWHARDIRFVLDKLSEPNGGRPFAGHMDLRHVGAFGHSFGGVAAAQACQTDARFTACLNQDGMAGWRPFNVNSGVWRPKQRFMMIYRAVPPGPPPAEFAELLTVLMHGYETAMQTVPGGAYEVALDSSKTTHMDFSDENKRPEVMATFRSLTLAFFDQTLRGKRSPLLDGKSQSEVVQSVRRFN